MKVKSIAVIISLSLMLILTACSSDYTRTIEKNWGVSLPKANEELYSVDSGPSIFGDGQRYHILGYEEIKLNEFAEFSSGKNTLLEDEVEKILNSLEASKDKTPDFSSKYYWYKKSEGTRPRNKLYLVYLSEGNLLHVIELLIPLHKQAF